MLITDLSQIEEMPLGKSEDLTQKDFKTFKAIKRVKPYTNSRAAHWLCQCNCGNYFVSTAAHLNNEKCKSCGCLQKEVAKKTLTDYKESTKGKPKQDHSGEQYGKLTIISFSHIDEYRNSHWLCKCECGKEKIIRWTELYNGDTKSCGCLQQSYGSYKIEQVLKDANIPYEKEKTFENCRFPKSNALARFDFFVDGVLIEFDGKQHYEYVGGFFTLDDFYSLQERDEYKNQWCKENNIPLIRIKYTEEDNINLDFLKEKIENGKREINSL